MTRIKIHISKAKLPFYPPYEVKCRLQNGVSTPWLLVHRVLHRKARPVYDSTSWVPLYISIHVCDGVPP